MQTTKLFPDFGEAKITTKSLYFFYFCFGKASVLPLKYDPPPPNYSIFFSVRILNLALIGLKESRHVRPSEDIFKH
jgi:hypothetical protein